jgi:hypothetical protein
MEKIVLMSLGGDKASTLPKVQGCGVATLPGRAGRDAAGRQGRSARKMTVFEDSTAAALAASFAYFQKMMTACGPPGTTPKRGEGRNRSR